MTDVVGARMIFRRALIALALLLVACIGGLIILLVSVDWPAWHVGGYQRQVDDGAGVIAAATTDAARAAGHIQRGRGYAEIARYRHVFKSVGAAEYASLYETAMRDLDAAVQLDPENAEAFNARGLTYFERSWAAGENGFEPKAATKTWLARAKADFTAVIDRDARNATVGAARRPADARIHRIDVRSGHLVFALDGIAAGRVARADPEEAGR